MIQAVTTRQLTENQRVAAELLGRCHPRRDIYTATGLANRPATISEWLAIPEFQDAVADANRRYIAELRETKSRLLQKSLDLVEAELDKAESKSRLEIAHSIVKSIL